MMISEIIDLKENLCLTDCDRCDLCDSDNRCGDCPECDRS